MRASLLLLLAAGLVLIGGASASAQTPAVICGTVTNPSGTPMPGVAVTLTSKQDKEASPAIATTDPLGGYLFPSVAPGTYSLSFTLDGFKKAVRPNVIILGSGLELRADMRMAPGASIDDVPANALASVGYVSRPTAATFTTVLKPTVAQDTASIRTVCTK